MVVLIPFLVKHILCSVVVPYFQIHVREFRMVVLIPYLLKAHSPTYCCALLLDPLKGVQHDRVSLFSKSTFSVILLCRTSRSAHAYLHGILYTSIKSWRIYGTTTNKQKNINIHYICLLYTSPSPRDKRQSRMPSSA